MRLLLDKIYDYRREQENILENNPDLVLGDVTSINVTKLKGGKQRNVLPPFVELTVDIRMALTIEPDAFEVMLKKWADDSGSNIELEFLVKEPYCPPTVIDETNEFWKCFTQAMREMNLEISPQVFPAGTDAAYLRHAGIGAIGFSPMNNTPALLHDHDEFLQADIYLKGIEIYKTIISNIANSGI